uniref:Uncharacterized protein n=1 Tax=Rhizophora mucronata TaxID=61149 RepID=A0A2P2R4V0_RHIMU
MIYHQPSKANNHSHCPIELLHVTKRHTRKIATH